VSRQALTKRLCARSEQCRGGINPFPIYRANVAPSDPPTVIKSRRLSFLSLSLSLSVCLSFSVRFPFFSSHGRRVVSCSLSVGEVGNSRERDKSAGRCVYLNEPVSPRASRIKFPSSSRWDRSSLCSLHVTRRLCKEVGTRLSGIGDGAIREQCE